MSKLLLKFPTKTTTWPEHVGSPRQIIRYKVWKAGLTYCVWSPVDFRYVETVCTRISCVVRVFLLKTNLQNKIDSVAPVFYSCGKLMLSLTWENYKLASYYFMSEWPIFRGTVVSPYTCNVRFRVAKDIATHGTGKKQTDTAVRELIKDVDIRTQQR